MGVGAIISLVSSAIGVGFSAANKFTNVKPWSETTFGFKRIFAPSQYAQMIELLRSLGYEGERDNHHGAYDFYKSLDARTEELLVSVVAQATEGDIDVGMVVTAISANPSNAMSILSQSVTGMYEQTMSTQSSLAGVYNRVIAFFQSYWKPILAVFCVIIYLKNK